MSVSLPNSGIDLLSLPKKGMTLNANATSFKPSMVSDEPKASKVEEIAGQTDNGLDSLTLSTNFTPSTPYVHKFRTELCKNWNMYGKCKYGDEVSSLKNLFIQFLEVIPKFLINGAFIIWVYF